MPGIVDCMSMSVTFIQFIDVFVVYIEETH